MGYTTDDGRGQIKLGADQPMVWLAQLEIAELFDATKQRIWPHCWCWRAPFPTRCWFAPWAPLRLVAPRHYNERYQIFPQRKETPRTLIFAKTDSHADDIINILREV